MSAGQPPQNQHLSNITTQNGSQGVYGHVQNVYFGNYGAPEGTANVVDYSKYFRDLSVRYDSYS